MSNYLIAQRGPEIGKKIDLKEGVTTIGRSNDNDIEINDPYISRYHAVIRQQGADFMLIDLGSENPVQIRDTALEPGEPYKLQHRDIIRIGQFVFTYLLASEIANRMDEIAATQAAHVEPEPVAEFIPAPLPSIAAPPPPEPEPSIRDAGATQVFSGFDRAMMSGNYAPEVPQVAPRPVEQTRHFGAMSEADFKSPASPESYTEYEKTDPSSPAFAAPLSLTALPDEEITGKSSFNTDFATGPAPVMPKFEANPAEGFIPAPPSASPAQQYDWQPEPYRPTGWQPTPPAPTAEAAEWHTPSPSPTEQFAASGPATQPPTPVAPHVTPGLMSYDEMGDAPTVVGADYGEALRQLRNQPAPTPPPTQSEEPTNPSDFANPGPGNGFTPAAPSFGTYNQPAGGYYQPSDNSEAQTQATGGNPAPQYGQYPQYGQPGQYPQYGQLPQQYDQYGQPQYGQPPAQYDQYGQPQYGQGQGQPPQYPQYGQPPQYDQYGQPYPQPQAPQYDQYGQPIYNPGQNPQYGQPGQYPQYGQQPPAPQYDQYGQPQQYDQYGQPIYNPGQNPQYGQPPYGQPQYGQAPVAPPPTAATDPNKPKEPPKPDDKDEDQPTAVIRYDKPKP